LKEVTLEPGDEKISKFFSTGKVKKDNGYPGEWGSQFQEVDLISTARQ